MVPYRDWCAPALLRLTMPNRLYIPPTKPKMAPRIVKAGVVPNWLSSQRPPRIGTIITPTKEVTMETHFVASAMLFTQHLSHLLQPFSQRTLRRSRVQPASSFLGIATFQNRLVHVIASSPRIEAVGLDNPLSSVERLRWYYFNLVDYMNDSFKATNGFLRHLLLVVGG
jgi:hypothetical protein